jgi:sterol 24-C-methyltransferase
MSTVTTKVEQDGREHERIGGYTQFWQKDLSKEQGINTDIRLEGYTDVVNGMCSHIPRRFGE